MASLSKPVSVPAPASQTTGAGVSCLSLERKVVTLESVGTATYQLQISCLDDGSGTVPAAGDASWVNYGSALTTSGSVEVSAPCGWVRWNCTAYTSGTPASHMMGVLNSAHG